MIRTRTPISKPARSRTGVGSGKRVSVSRGTRRTRPRAMMMTATVGHDAAGCPSDPVPLMRRLPGGELRRQVGVDRCVRSVARLRSLAGGRIAGKVEGLDVPSAESIARDDQRRSRSSAIGTRRPGWQAGGRHSPSPLPRALCAVAPERIEEEIGGQVHVAAGGSIGFPIRSLPRSAQATACGSLI